MTIGLIGGSGLNTFFAEDSSSEKSIETPYGVPSAAIQLDRIHGNKIAFLARHGQPHRYPPDKIPYRANLFALKKLGCEKIIAVNAVGGIHPDMQAPTHIVLPDQLIDYTYGREHSYYDASPESPERLPTAINPYLTQALDHIEFGQPFCENLRQQLITSAHYCDLSCSATATYGCTQGPRLETEAEIRKLTQDGCDIVGMTAMPEAALAKELGMSYASVCLVVNPAAGCSDQPITMNQLHQAMIDGMGNIKRLVKHTLESLR